MKKVLSTLFVAGMLLMVSCGQSAEEKQAQEKATQDSIAAAEQSQKVAQEQSAMQDSMNRMADTLKAGIDSLNKMMKK